MTEDQNLEQKRENKILAILQLAENDYNAVLDALIKVATAAKIKTSINLIGINAILNEKEPESYPESEEENIMKSGAEPGM